MRSATRKITTALLIVLSVLITAFVFYAACPTCANDVYGYRVYIAFAVLFLLLTKGMFEYKDLRTIASIKRELANELDLSQANLNGERVFISKIRLTLKDGEWESVALIPGTTVVDESVKEKATIYK